MIKVDGVKISMFQHDNGVLNFKLNNRFLEDGDKVYFLVKKDYDQDYYDIEIVVDTFTDGEAVIFISGEDSSIKAGTYRYAICVHTKEGLISTVISGSFKLMEGVHHESE